MTQSFVGLEQLKQYSALTEIAPGGDTTLDTVISNINSVVKEPGALSFPGGNAVLTVGATNVTIGPSGKLKALPQISGVDVGSITGTFTFTGNPNVTVTGSAVAVANVSLTSGQFVKVGIEIRSDAQIYAIFGTPGASQSAAGAPIFSKKSIPLGYIVLENNGTAGTGNVLNRTNANIYAFGSGSGGASSGAAGVNYLVSSSKAWDFEDGNADGWSAYADAAGTSPVDGTGGSPNVTFAVSASSPLRGSYNGLFTKDAANRQGQGASVNFTLDSADKSKPFSVIVDTETSANYTGSSGTEYARIFVYDVTNSALLPGYIEVPVGSGPARGFFLATTSTSYRLIFHVAGTGTSAWTLKVDNVQVGPQDILFGLAGHEAISYTPTLEGGFTNTIVYAKYSRVGKRILIESRIDVTGGGSGADVTFSLPTGLTFNLGSGTNEVGSGVFTDVSVPASHSVQLTSSPGSSSKCGFVLTSNQNNILQGNDLASGDNLYVSISFEVNEWSANVQMADRSVEEYAFNTSTSTTTDDTTSFGYGALGAQIQNVTAALARRVRFQTPVLPTDSLILELSYNRSLWRPAMSMGYFDASGNSRVAAFQSQNGVTYGIGLANASTDPRDIDLSVGQYAHPSGATFGSAGTAWSTGAGSLYWRIRKVSGGAAVGFPVSSRNIIGHIPTSGSDVVPTGYVGELISATQTRSGHPALTTGVQANLVSISLTPGVWDLSGILKFEGATGVSAAQLFGGISTTSASIDFYEGNNVFEINKTFTTGDDVSYPFGVSRMIVSSTTTVYLVTRASFSGGSLWHYGTLRATRVG